MDIQFKYRSISTCNLASNIWKYPGEYSDGTVCLAYRYIINNYIMFRKGPTAQDVFNRVISWYYSIIHSENQTKRNTACELLDIIHEYGNNQVITEALNSMRIFDMNITQRINQPVQHTVCNADIPVSITTRKTVYTDSQNVHNSGINSSVNNSAKKLCTDYNTYGLSYDDILPRYMVYRDKYMSASTETALNRILTDIARFQFETPLINIFVALCDYINVSETAKTELEKRLVEELIDMAGLCASGHMSRLINVLQGFSDSYPISISDMAQLKSVVFVYITDALRKCGDPTVLENISSKNKAFIRFVNECISQEKISEWVEVYGCTEKDIHRNVRLYISG